MRARIASGTMIFSGAVVMLFGVLAHPPQSVSSGAARVVGGGMHMFLHGGMTLVVSIFAIGAAVLFLGLIMLMRAGKVDEAVGDASQVNR